MVEQKWDPLEAVVTLPIDFIYRMVEDRGWSLEVLRQLIAAHEERVRQYLQRGLIVEDGQVQQG